MGIGAWFCKYPYEELLAEQHSDAKVSEFSQLTIVPAPILNSPNHFCGFTIILYSLEKKEKKYMFPVTE